MPARIFFLISLVVLCLNCFSAEHAATNSYEIKTSTRTFVPIPGVEPELAARLKNAKRVTIHGIAQLNRLISAQEFTNLVSAGVRLRGYAGGTAYEAEFSPKFAIENTGNLVRWAGLFTPDDKTHKKVR